MLLEFRLKNVLSFKEETCLSMIASSSNSKKESTDPVIKVGKHSILSSVAIYGANASGKSNFLAAIRFMKYFIFGSSRESQVGDDIKVNCFKFNSSCSEKPSTFEITFLVQGVDYKNEKKDVIFRYGFQVDKKRVQAEWLFGRFTAQESKLFERLGDDIQIGEKYLEGKQVYKATGKIRKTTLFLSLVASIKGENAKLTDSIMSWFHQLRDLSSIADDNFYGITASLMSEKDMKELIIKALCFADICVEDISIKKEPVDLNELPIEIKEDLEKQGKNISKLHTLSVKSYHKKYNDKKEEIGTESLDFDKEESDGSKKFFSLIGPVLDALKNGLTLVIDEIDSRLHPILCNVIISLFNSKSINKKHGQLIFATHNTLLMNPKTLRRDQIYFVEKDKYGESELYSLLDYKKVRSDASYDKDYLLGKYGAIPYLGDFESLVTGDK